MTSFVEEPHIAELIARGGAVLVGAEVCKAFASHLATLPWLGSGLDWSKMPKSSAIDLSSATGDALADWIRSTRLGSGSHVVLFYAADQPGVACTPTDLAANFDTLVWKAPGRRFLFGATFREGRWQPDVGSVGEYDGADTLTALSD